MTAEEAYAKLLTKSKETALLGSCGSVLGWDERTYMPKGGVEHRGDQIALLAGMVHERLTDPAMGEWLSVAEDGALIADPVSNEAVNVREWRRCYDRATKLPKSLVEEIARVTTVGQQVWAEARIAKDFGKFQSTLVDVVRLKKEEARALSNGSSLYDALLEDYEPGETTDNLLRVFGSLRDALVPLVERVRNASKKPDLSILHRDYPEDLQATFGTEVAAAIGFDFNQGRLDITTHPFCSGLGSRRYEDYDTIRSQRAQPGLLRHSARGRPRRV